MSKFVFAAIALLLLCFITSCQVEKRVHRKGYHVQWHKPSKKSVAPKDQVINFLPSPDITNDDSIIRDTPSNKAQDLIASSQSDFVPEYLTEDPDDFDCDTLFLKDGSFLLVQIFEETPLLVTYADCLNPIGAFSEIKKSDLAAIHYSNGRVDDLAPAEGCETLVLYSGQELQVNLIEILPNLIIYKPCDVPDGPRITVKKYEVSKIIYTNGVEEDYEKANVSSGERTLEGFGLASIFLAIVGLFIFGIVFGPLALITGILSIDRWASRPQQFYGKSLGIIGLIVGTVVTTIMIIYFASL